MTLYDAIFPLSFGEIMMIVLWFVSSVAGAFFVINLEKKKEKINE